MGGAELVLTSGLQAAAAVAGRVNGRDGPSQALALLPSGALLQYFDYGVLLQQASVKCPDPWDRHHGRTTSLEFRINK